MLGAMDKARIDLRQVSAALLSRCGALITHKPFEELR
ncbi:hypothetical protein YSA_01371 [Pseudomonas putida ND6]|uniref:Uncharacterized protein n=1 Tax=Pseudomonas putida ND6 TaxID=231023 RepID=I3UPU1_PSEPU|nr:hypothetical protein YSA_01371 [Pseudomonas putida ND6]